MPHRDDPGSSNSSCRTRWTASKSPATAAVRPVRPLAATILAAIYGTCDHPEFLNDFVEGRDAEARDYNPKTSCCGGSVSVYRGEMTLHLIKNDRAVGGRRWRPASSRSRVRRATANSDIAQRAERPSSHTAQCGLKFIGPSVDRPPQAPAAPCRLIVRNLDTSARTDGLRATNSCLQSKYFHFLICEHVVAVENAGTTNGRSIGTIASGMFLESDFSADAWPKEPGCCDRRPDRGKPPPR